MIKKCISGGLLFAVPIVGTLTPAVATEANSVATAELSVAEFRTPPHSSRPRTWWHWLSGNVTKEGITKDLEAMDRIGLKGAQVVTMPQGAPYGEVKFLSPQWKAAAAHAANEAVRLGMDLGFANSIACSGAGGPWISVEDSMQELVWTETQVVGAFNGNLPLRQPKAVEGYYRDIAVYAYPTIAGDAINLSLLSPEITSTIAANELGSVMDQDSSTKASLLGTEDPHRIEFEFSEAQTVYSFQAWIGDQFPKHLLRQVDISLFSSDDGRQWRRRLGASAWSSVYSGKLKQLTDGRFNPITARFFKLEIKVPAGRTLDLHGVALGGPRLPGIHHKAARSRNHPSGFAPVNAELPKEQVIASDSILNLTEQLDASGVLHCELPEGSWTIVRMGHTSNGHYMGSDTPAEEDVKNRGLEADKMRRETVLKHLNEGLPGQIVRQMQDVDYPVNVSILIDSWECGEQTWTRDFAAEFKQRRGYDCIPWLPVVTGRVIESVNETERFLWDFRRTIADLYAENYFGTFRDFCHENGLILEGEAPGIGIPAIADGLQCLGMMDTPMGEFWIRAEPGPDQHWGPAGQDNTKEAAVAAHVYGKELVTCEAFTSFGYGDGWRMDPQKLKPFGDQQFIKGMNELMFHCFAHQPDDRVPGMTLGQFGLNFTRSLTWWEQGRDWIEYNTRCQHMLRQGRFVADVCFFYGENGPSSVYYYVPDMLNPRERHLPITPEGYDYDCADWTTLNRMTVVDGRVTLPHGMSYPYLILPADARLTLHALEKVKELVLAGATVIGPVPERTPSLSGYPASEARMAAIAGELWPQNGETQRRTGKGRVIVSDSLESVFALDGLLPDFEVRNSAKDTDIRYIHREIGETDFYFVSNQQKRHEAVTLLFRVDGKVPEIWDPETGEVHEASVYDFESGRTAVGLVMEPLESFFVVFRKDAVDTSARIVGLKKDGLPTALRVMDGSASSTQQVAVLGSELPAPDIVTKGDMQLQVWEPGRYTVDFNTGAAKVVEVATVPAPKELRGPWQVAFQAERSAPAEPIVFEDLVSWTERSEEGIKYFSGTASYQSTFHLDSEQLQAGKSTLLDLGRVKNLAEVFVNGESLGVLWRAPFQVDITSALKSGENQLEIRVTNLWGNRLIGDESLPEEQRVTWGFYRFYRADSPLAESGLLGPVRLLSSIEANL